MTETLLGVDVMDQPLPPRNEGGDCFACCVGAAVRHLCPDAEIDFDWASGLFLQENGTYNSSWIGIKTALEQAQDEYPLEVQAHLVEPTFDPTRWSHAWYGSPPSAHYVRRLETWLAAGWIAIAAIYMDGATRGIVDGGFCMTDHFVLFDGTRVRKEDEDLDSGGSVTHEVPEIHVVDSSTRFPDYRWKSASDLMTEHGAAAWWLVRRDDRRAP